MTTPSNLHGPMNYLHKCRFVTGQNGHHHTAPAAFNHVAFRPLPQRVERTSVHTVTLMTYRSLQSFLSILFFGPAVAQ